MDETQAMKKLRKMKVWNLMELDGCKTFTDYWYRCAYETDLFQDYCLGYECDIEGYRNHLGKSAKYALNMATFKSARKWMDETKHLTTD